MAELNFRSNTPEKLPNQANTWEVLSSTNNRKKVTIEEMLAKFNWNTEDDTQEVKKIKSILDWLKWLEGDHKEALEILLWRYDYLDSSVWIYTLLMMIEDLEALNKKYKEWKDKVKADTKKQEKELRKNTWENIEANQISTDLLKQIQDITIEWSISSIDEFKTRLEKLKTAIISSEEFKKLSSEEQNNFLSNIDWYSQEVDKTQQLQLEFLNKKIDSLAQQVENQTEWTTVIKLEDGSAIEFDSKKEAFEFIKAFKQNAENELESILGSFLNDTLWYLWDNLIVNWFQALLSPFYLTFKSAQKFINANIEDDTSDKYLYWTWTIWLLILSGLYMLASRNFLETLHRRIIIDNIARTPINKYRWKIIKIPDFDITQEYYGWEEDVKLRNEYSQRINAIRKLKETMWWIQETKDRIAFEKELHSVQSYLNIKTDTFWLKAHSLAHNEGIYKRSRNMLVNWPWWLQMTDKITKYFIIDSTARKEILQWLQFLFKGARLESNWSWWFTAEDCNVESDEVKAIKSYVYSRTDISDLEKKEIIERIDNFKKNINNMPRWINYVKRELINIAKNNYLLKNELKTYLTEQIESNTKNNLWKKLSKIYWQKFYSFMVFWNSQIYKLNTLIDLWIWEWTKADIDKHLLNPKISKFKTGWKAVDINEIYQLIKQWNKYEENLIDWKNIIKWDVWKNLRNITSLFSDRFSVDEEILFNNIYDRLIKDLEENNIFLKADEAKLELVKLYNKYLPTSTIINIISWKESYKTNLKKLDLDQKNVKDFVNKVKNWKWIWDLNDLEEAIKSLSKGSYIWDKLHNFNINEWIEEIKKLWSQLEELSFENGKYWLPVDWNKKIDTNSFRDNELQLIKFLNKLSWTNPLKEDKFNEFMRDIDKGIGYIFEEFYDEMDKVLWIDIHPSLISSRNSYLINIWNKINNIILPIIQKLENGNISLSEKDKILNDLKNKLWKPIEMIWDNEKEFLRKADVQIDNLLKAVIAFENKKERLRQQEEDDLKNIEQEKKSKLNELDEKLKFLKWLLKYSEDNLREWYNDYELDAHNRWIDLNLGTVVWSNNKQKITNIYNQLEAEKLKIEKPIKYLTDILDQVWEKLELEWYSKDLLSDEYDKIIQSDDVTKLIDAWDFDTILNEIHTRIDTNLSSSKWLDIKIAKGVIDSIKENGFRFTR